MLDKAFEALKTFDFGTPLSEVQAIEDTMVAAHTDANVRKELEQRLVEVLSSKISRDAKDYVCRKLALVGTGAAVQAVASLLPNEGNSHMARHALERIPGNAASAALASAAKSLTGKLKLGAISSLGVRGEVSGVSTLASLLQDQDASVVRAAALALGAIGGNESAAVLQSAIKATKTTKSPLIDALLSCAESMIKQKKTKEATSIYSALTGMDQPRLVRLAATRGLLACAGA